jgi:AcrR family transcriptional regulator
MQQLTNLGDQTLAALPPRERILKTASDLFYRFSIHTVGIDRIIAESGVAKMTFYKHFPSKARLIAEYLQLKTVLWLQMLAAATDRPGLSPVERIVAIFDALDISFQQAPFRGCPFVKGLAEFGPDADTPEIKSTIALYFESLHDLVADVIAPLQRIDHEKTVLQILSLIQGAIVMAQAMSDCDIAGANRDAARMLLETPAR